jgi:heat shock protein HslJ
MKRSLKVAPVVILLLAVFSAGGCAKNESPAAGPSSAQIDSHDGRLAQTTWALTSYASETGQQAVLPDTTITATFDSGYITGSAGCNRYSATYQLSGNEIKVSSIASTLMYCAIPDGVMTQETTYLLLLKTVTSYTISDNVLTLSGEVGSPQLMFHSAPA